ncbi:hypothetical protein AAFC00_004287 [Neodothiora populina]|uniref:HECT-type E3 ubiquitin transferase n=1 Tax=Neodothiora populina TaxID=2781224 RepID=A0ABR3PJD7_9PEZI
MPPWPAPRFNSSPAPSPNSNTGNINHDGNNIDCVHTPPASSSQQPYQPQNRHQQLSPPPPHHHHHHHHPSSVHRRPVPSTPQDLPPLPLSPSRPVFSHHGSQPRIAPSPTRRPPSSGADRHHTHNRSVSNPLPKFFGRKRSHPTLHLPADLPPDDALVPVLESPVAAQTPTRVINGKKNDDERDMASRQCMCCDSKLRFPRDVKVFRCTNCLTVNDIEPHKPKAAAQGDSRPETRSAPDPGTIAPFSIQRCREIIDRCLVNYLEARCRRPPAPARPEVASADPFIKHDTVSGHDPSQQGTAAAAARTFESPIGLPSTAANHLPRAEWSDKSEMNDSVKRSLHRLSPHPHARTLSSPQAPITPTSGPSTGRAAPPVSHAFPPLPDRRPPPPPITNSSGHGPARPRDGMQANAPPGPPAMASDISVAQANYERVKVIFKPLEDYLLSTYGNHACLNISFNSAKQHISPRARSESALKTPPPEPAQGTWPSPLDSLQNMDAKTLMIGDFAENGQWWTGRAPRKQADRHDRNARERKRLTTSRTPHIDWEELNRFYELVRAAGARWWEKVDHLNSCDVASIRHHLKGPKNAQEIDNDLTEARAHAGRALLKITENVLKRPGRPLVEPDDVRFLMLILMNPVLYANTARPRAPAGSAARPMPNRGPPVPPSQSPHDPVDRVQHSPPKRPGPSAIHSSREPEQHAGIRKRILGLMSYSSDNCHRYLIGWFCRLPEARFLKIVDLVASFVTYRLLKRRPRTRSHTIPHDGGLIPDLSGSARNTSAQIRAATGLGGGVRIKDMEPAQNIVDYSEDWQLKAAAKVMALLFVANNTWQSRRSGSTPAMTGTTSLSRPRAKTHGQLLPTSDFYNTLLDYNDLVVDFKAWEQKKGKFTFCQFPFFLSMGAKIKVLEYDARRQMELKAREAYFDSVTTNRAIDGYLHLRVRRDCMVDDSLQQISAAVGQGQEELKKGLKVQFTGEEGIDAGGLRKEWFLMIVRDIFDPEHGMFLYDDDSRTCYFNPSTFETSDQYYLVGALLGLAIYNSTILDIALPPFAFRKLLAAAPPSATNPSLPITGARAPMTYTIDDLAEYRPALAAGLRQLLDFDGDVQETFCRDFVAPVERYGTVTDIPLCPGGENKPVTNSNRHEFVDLYIRYLLDVSVSRQFEPFKRGFFTVCAGNALSLFRPEEIELLVRGSDEALDVNSLRAVAVYENWKSPVPPHQVLPDPAETAPQIAWFWDFFAKVSAAQQRQILGFITGSDRIPAVGATSLILKISCGGDGIVPAAGDGIPGAAGQDAEAVMARRKNAERFPIARTCFNMLVLWLYPSREVLEEKLWRAVSESEGFGLK